MKYVNFSTTLFQTPDGRTLLNSSIDYSNDMSKQTIQFSFAVPKDKNDKNYENVIIKSNANLCKIGQGVMGDFIVRMAMEDFHKFADFNITCPFKKGHYTITNFEVPDKFLPTQLLISDFKYLCLIKAFGKIKGIKSMVHIITLKAVGEVHRT